MISLAISEMIEVLFIAFTRNPHCAGESQQLPAISSYLAYWLNNVGLSTSEVTNKTVLKRTVFEWCHYRSLPCCS